MNKFLKTILATAFISFIPLPTLAASFSPVGNWTAGESNYKIYLCGDHHDICARLIWLSKANRTPENLRLLDHTVVSHAKYNGNNTWTGTIILNGNKYSATMKLNGENSMFITGCAIVCQSYNLTRI